MTDSSAAPENRPSDELGGIASTADKGLADAAERSFEHGDDAATGLASTGNAQPAGASPRTDLGGKNEPGSAPGTTGPSAPAATREMPAGQGAQAAGAGRDATRSGAAPGSASAGGTPVTHQGDVPPAEGPLESFGRAVSEVVTGSLDNQPKAAPDAPRR